MSNQPAHHLRNSSIVKTRFSMFSMMFSMLVLLTGCWSKKDPPKPVAEASASFSQSQADPSANSTESSDAVPEFTICVYNVENLFDIDGIALFEDYRPDRYGPGHLLVKLKNITRVLSAVDDGKGPAIILFQEFESDQSNRNEAFDYGAFIKQYAETSIEAMLTEPVSDTIKDLPAEALLLKTCHDQGLGPYEVVVGQYRPDPLGRTVAHVNVTFSRFPVLEARTHQSPGARGALEVVHQIGDYKLYTFGNHWKSGASNPKEETLRVGNAQALRDRLNEVLRDDPFADVVIGGDFNSQYNQLQRFPNMKQTGVNSVLGSQGNEWAIRQPGGPNLYNLWYELPPEDRRSDTYQGEWGTLMQMLITRGLYDYRGVQYVDNSFGTLALENVNAQMITGMPFRWKSVNGSGAGFSDHLPIMARFRVARENDSSRFLELKHPGTEGNTIAETSGVKTNHQIADAKGILATRDLGSDAAVGNLDGLGKIYLVEATVSAEKPMRIKLFRDEFKIWSFDRDLRTKIYERFPVGSTMKFYGELDFHEGMWQFLVHDESWLSPGP